MGVRSTFQLSRTTGLNALLARAYRRIFFGSLFTWFERCGFHFLPVDYSSLVPDTRALRKRLPEWYRPSELPGIEARVDSSHILKLGNDGSYLYLALTPRNGFSSGTSSGTNLRYSKPCCAGTLI